MPLPAIGQTWIASDYVENTGPTATVGDQAAIDGFSPISLTMMQEARNSEMAHRTPESMTGSRHTVAHQSTGTGSPLTSGSGPIQSHMPLCELLDAVCRNANLPRSQAEATPPQVYSSPEFLELERDRIFNREWICVGRWDEFANPGDYRVVTISRDQVIIIRGHDGVLRAMSNICRHRMASLLEGEGNLTGKITCPYHAWSYTFDGQLAGAAFMSDDFDKGVCQLPQFAIEDWLGWVYVNLDKDAELLAPRMATLATRFVNYDLPSYRTLFRVTEVWKTNWKILFQNFTEGYHLFAVHPSTVDHVLPTSRASVQEGGLGYCLFNQDRVPGVAYEYGEAMQNPNPA